MTSVNDELRRMLDERGVEYTVIHGYQEYIWEFGESGIARASRIGTNGLVQMIVTGITPAQAIAATLGTETCHDEGDPSDFCCSECGVRMFTDTSDTYTMIASDGRTIIEHPNDCPNCGRKVVTA